MNRYIINVDGDIPQAVELEQWLANLLEAVNSIHEFVETHPSSEHTISHYIDWLREQTRLTYLRGQLGTDKGSEGRG